MFEYQDILINYKDYGKRNDEAILYLHGWGQNIEMMEPIANPFVETHRLIIIDLPGFGKSDEPKTIWTLEDYVLMIHALLEKLHIKKVNVVGHSFGGKLALLYASKYEVEHLVLLASPFKIKIEKMSLKTKILKTLKKVPVLNKLANFAKKHIGSKDYRDASLMMREILVKHVGTSLVEEAKMITSPTIIIWGTLDEAVPLSDAYELESLIKDSAVIKYEGCTHYAYLERLNETINILKSFIK